ncbi:MAG: tetratricopeptide repeat protein, partial [Bacteroidota bacterium]
MRFTLSVLFLLIYFFVPRSGLQAGDIDSLQNVLKHENRPSERLEVLLDLSWQLKNSDTQLAWDHATEALGIAHAISDLSQKAMALKHMGVIRWYESDLEGSRNFLDSARYYFQLTGHQEGLADIHNNLGLNYHIEGSFGDALQHYEKALQLRQELRDTAGMTISLVNMGVLYHELGDQHKAIDLYNRTVSLLQQTKDEARLGDTYLNVGNYYLEEEQ